MTDKKICVYAICKNEMEWIDRWLENMSEADYIVVLDTGSTDGSFEKLRDDPRVTRSEQKIINPWRFDVARNESMTIVPDDAEILVCTDFDEVFESGWAQVLRDNWEDNDNRCHYHYAWSHNDLGEPQDVFVYDKIHTRDYHWKFPVHEVLESNFPDKDENIFDAKDAIYLHHLRDHKKSRGYYLDLLKLSVKENPDEPHCQMILAREYLLNNDLETALKEYTKVFDYPNLDTERFACKIESTGRLGDIHFAMGHYTEALEYYRDFIFLCNNHREPYFCMGEIYNRLGMYTLAEAITNAGFRYSVQCFDWIERKDNWISKGNDILSVAYYYLGNYDAALENVKIAYEHNQNDVRIMKNYNSIMRAYYEGIIDNNVIGT